MVQITPVKIQTNLSPALDNTTNSPKEVSTTTGASFSEHLLDAFEHVAETGNEAETISTTQTNTTELAMAMDQFLVELDALKALVNETRKALDRIFQESKA